LSHLVIVPSKIDSPIWGITTSVGMCFLSAVLQIRLVRQRKPVAHRGQTLIINPHAGKRARNGSASETAVQNEPVYRTVAVCCLRSAHPVPG
jgi:hypothetical protein